MATFSKVFLSQMGIGGHAVKIAGTVVGSATTIHTTGTSSSTYDEVWLWAYNSDSVERELCVLIAGTTQPDDEVKITIPAKIGWIPILEGQLMSGAFGTGLSVKAYAAAADVLMVRGYVNRITP